MLRRPGVWHVITDPALTWTLEDDAGKTRLTLSQDNNDSAAAAEHSQGMWDKLVADARKIAERA